MAEEDIDSPFDIEDVAKGVADKLIRRHPHVFGETKVGSSEEVLENWESQKAAEKGRTSLIDGVPLAQPALSLATKIIYRINKLDAQLPISKSVSISPEITEDQFGELLLGLIAQAVEKGIDPEAALRSAAKSLIERIKIHESR
jgi:XTP/dITP diphosphohydrolase